MSDPAKFGGKELELKKEFARHVAGGMPRFTAAMQLWPQDAAFAYWAHERWANDPYVDGEIKKYETEAEDKTKAPTKKALAMEILDRVRNTLTGDNYLKGMRLVADMLGYVERPAQNNGQSVTNTVMIVKDLGDEGAWQLKAREQQRRLKLENAATIDHDEPV